MRKALLTVFLTLIICILTLGATFLPKNITVPWGPTVALPDHTAPDGVAVSAITTGIITTTEAFVFRGGDFTKSKNLGIGSVLIEHPQGALLIDAGFGKNAKDHSKTIPWLMQAMSEITYGPTARQQLEAAGFPLNRIQGIILTHAHWDHLSGVEDFPNTPVLLSPKEQKFVKTNHPSVQLAKMLLNNNQKVYKFESGPYLDFPESHDYFGDHSVVIVPAAGHTPGSVIVFVNTSSGDRYAFIGDVSWSKEGVELPAERPWLARSITDHGAGKVRRLLGRLHKIKKQNPQLIVVPAHDFSVWKKLPQLKHQGS